jgi:hypothetical protein
MTAQAWAWPTGEELTFYTVACGEYVAQPFVRSLDNAHAYAHRLTDSPTHRLTEEQSVFAASRGGRSAGVFRVYEWAWHPDRDECVYVGPGALS